MIFHHPSLAAFALWIGMVVNDIHPALSDYLIVIGALGFAAASLRSGRMKVLRDTNTDLTARNRLLEEEKIELTARIVKLESKPDLRQHAAVLEAMMHSLQEHDNRAQLAASESQRVFAQMINELKDIRIAVVPPNRPLD